MRRPTMPRTPPARMSTLPRPRRGPVERSLLLAAADHVGDEVVDLAHVPAQVAAQLGILGGLTQRLHPQLGELVLAVDRTETWARAIDASALPMSGASAIARSQRVRASLHTWSSAAR